MGSAHAVFAAPGFGTPRESIQPPLACASAVQPLDQPFRQSSISRATSPLGAVHGLGPCRFRSPRVWYAPGIDPTTSRLRFGCPTAGPTIPSKLYLQSYLSPRGSTWARPMPFSLPQGLVRPGNRSNHLSLALRLSNLWTNHSVKALSPELPLPMGRYMGSAHAVFAPQGLVLPGNRSKHLSLALRLSNRWTNHSTIALSPELPLPQGRYMGSAHAVFAPPGFGTPRESIQPPLACASAVQPLDQPFRSATLRPGLLPVLAVAVQVGHHAHKLPS